MIEPVRLLVDARNFHMIAPQVIAKMQDPNIKYMGFDCETEDSRKHPGLLAQQKAKNGKGIIFDIRRTVITGASMYFGDSDGVAYYFNLGHADVENRIAWDDFYKVLEARHDGLQMVCHNAVYERTVFLGVKDYLLKNLICSMYLCVTAYNTDTYNLGALPSAIMNGIKPLIGDIVKTWSDYVPGKELTPAQADVYYKFAGKESTSAWAYNGIIKTIAWGYGLKQAVKSWFGYEMMTFEQCLRGRNHMGELTGEETYFYGCDDAIWCLRLYHKLMGWLFTENPNVIPTFFRQENPMVEVYSDAWLDGIRINHEKVAEQFEVEKRKAGEVLVKLRKACAKLLPFPAEPNEWLMKADKWYQGEGYTKYRAKLEAWIKLKPGTVEEELSRIGGALFEDGTEEKGIFTKKKAPAGNINLTHYMPVRTLIFDLFREKPVYSKGKIQSDADAKGRLTERITKRLEAGEGDTEFEKAKQEVLVQMNELARIEQVMKLYLKPYQNLVDPETGRIYPLITSMLNTRRTSMQDPNGQQLAKNSASSYVRSFYLADDDDEVIVSADWSSIELVLPGEFSGDPAFLDAFSTVPYKDLHVLACKGAIKAWKGVDLSVEDLKAMKFIEEKMDDYKGLDLITHKGEKMTPADFFKYMRRDIGKVSNFNYWYSGALGSVGELLGWTSDVMWEATDGYRQTFSVGEAWRKSVIETAVATGKIQLPDHHIRYRFEATPAWAELMMSTFNAYQSRALTEFGKYFVKKMQTRAKNQAVNALIQGTSATLAKRSAVAMRRAIRESGCRARFMLLIHDELLFSVHKDDVLKFIPVFRKVMVSHPEIVSRVLLNVSVAVGRHFEPFKGKVAGHKGQIELDEAPKVHWLPKDKWEGPLDDENIQKVMDYLYDKIPEAA